MATAPLTARLPPAPMAPAAVPRRRAAARDARHVDARARAGRRARRSTSRRASSRCCTRSGSARCRSRSAATRRGRPARAHGPRRRRRHRARSARREPGDVLGVRGPFGNGWPVDEAARAATSSSSPAASAWRRCGPALYDVLRSARRVRRRRPALRQPHAGGPALRRRARALARPLRPRGRRDRRHRRAAAGAASVGVVPKLIAPAPVRPGGGDRDGLRARDHDALHRRGAPRPRRPGRADPRLDGAQHAVRRRPVRALPARPDAGLPRRARLLAGTSSSRCWRCGSCERGRKPKLAVWKFASCDGCQLTLLDCEDELLALAGEVEIAYFLEATQRRSSRARTTCRSSRARSRRRTTRSGSSRCARVSRRLVTIGACATAGGIQALRNFADVDEFVSIVYASPEYISTLATSTPISGARAASTSSCAAARSTSASCSR